MGKNQYYTDKELKDMAQKELGDSIVCDEGDTSQDSQLRVEDAEELFAEELEASVEQVSSKVEAELQETGELADEEFPNAQTNVVYILTNPTFPHLIKMGVTTDLKKRLKELNQLDIIPYSYRVYAIYETSHRLTNKTLRAMLTMLNPKLAPEDGKDFYMLDAEDACAYLKAVARISGTESRLHRVSVTPGQLKDEKDALAMMERYSKMHPYSEK